jgi:hypothetical protein
LDQIIKKENKKWDQKYDQKYDDRNDQNIKKSNRKVSLLTVKKYIL